VTEEDRNRFPNAYHAFKKGIQAPAIGTPVEMLGLGPSTLDSLKQKGIRTVEDLSELSDIALQGIGLGAREMKDRAKAFLARSTEATVSLQAENAELKAQLAELAAKVSALAEKPDTSIKKVRVGWPKGKPRKPREQTP
jgi:hypothetical protein